MVESLSVPDGTGGVVLLVAYRIDAAYSFLTVAGQTMKVIYSKPARSLKYE